MGPLLEARSRVATFLKEVIRASVFRTALLNDIGYEDLTEEYEKQAEEGYKTMLKTIEIQYDLTKHHIKVDDEFAHAYLYYSLFASTLISFIIGSNIR